MNKRLIQRQFNSAASTYDKYAYVQTEIAQRLLSHFDGILIDPEVILDLGTSTGTTASLLRQQFPEADVIGVDFAEGLLKQSQRPGSAICADAEALPFKDASMDCVASNLMLQWCDISKVFNEVQRILKPNGLWIFSTLGPDSMFEIKQSWASVDDHHHANDFLDLHDVGDALVKSKLIEPVMEMEPLTLHYHSLKALMQDIRGIGAQNRHPQQSTGLMGKQRWQAFTSAFDQFKVDNAYPLTYEVIYGHAWKAEPSQTVTQNAQGEAHFPLDYLRRR